MQQYDRARDYLAQTLEKEAQSKVANNRRLQGEVKQNIDAYNAAVSNINICLEAMQLTRKKLPIISESDLLVVPVVSDVIDTESVVIDEISDSTQDPAD